MIVSVLQDTAYTEKTYPEIPYLTKANDAIFHVL